MDIESIIKEYYEQLYAHKFDSLYEMGQFLKRLKLSRLTVGETDHLNRPICIQEIIWHKPLIL